MAGRRAGRRSRRGLNSRGPRAIRARARTSANVRRRLQRLERVTQRSGSATGRITQDFMSKKTKLKSEPPVRCIRLVKPRRPTAYDRDQHDLICKALKVSNDPNAPGDTAYEAVCKVLYRQDMALAAKTLAEAKRRCESSRARWGGYRSMEQARLNGQAQRREVRASNLTRSVRPRLHGARR